MRTLAQQRRKSKLVAKTESKPKQLKKKEKNHLNSFAEGSHAYHVCDDLLPDELVDNVGQVRHLCYRQCYLCHNHLLSHCHHFIVTWTSKPLLMMPSLTNE